MTSPIKKTTFDEYRTTLNTMLNHIDDIFIVVKNRQKNLLVWHGCNSYSEYLDDVYKTALRATAKDLNLSEKAISDRFSVLTLPLPVYDALETDQISYSKAKLITCINFDFDNDNDINVLEDIVNEIKKGIEIPEIKTLLKNKAKKVWNPSNIIIQKIALQHGINNKSTF